MLKLLNLLKLKERETGIEPATSRLGKMPVVCLSKTSLFTEFIETIELRQNCKNDTILALNGVNGVGKPVRFSRI
jgi:hypothetical protein